METEASSVKVVSEKLRSIGISESYASQIANNKRPPSQPLAIRIFRETGLRLGPLVNASDDEIDVLERITKRAAG